MASMSPKGTWLNPSGIGRKAVCFSNWPVAARAASVRPWKASVVATTANRSGPAHRRASLMAHSLASAPELAKNTWPPARSTPPPISRSRVTATSGPMVLPNRLETWLRVRAWVATASATTGWAWPSDVTARPERKSRYGRPSVSNRVLPSPRTKVTAGSA